MSTLEKLIKFYENEIKIMRQSLENPQVRVHWDKKQLTHNAIQRGLGVAFFAQEFDDITYQEIEKEYNWYKDELERL